MSSSQAIFTLLPPFFESSPKTQTKKYCLDRIEKEFGLEIKKSHKDPYSFASDVFTINDTYVFRFPRSLEVKQHFKYEVELLDFLHDKVKLQIPHYSFVSKDKEFGGYKLIPGEPLYVPTTKKVSKENKIRIVDGLIEFINVLHSINPQEFIKFKPLRKKDFVKTEKDVEEALQSKLFPHLSKKDIKRIQDFYSAARKLVSANSNECPIHGDLYEWNVIWDRRNESFGLIDFGDFMISDPARDFEVFYDFGPEYPEMAYKKYRGTKDPNFLERAEIYWKLHGIYTLMSSQLGANISFNYAYKSFFKRKFG